MIFKKDSLAPLAFKGIKDAFKKQKTLMPAFQQSNQELHNRQYSNPPTGSSSTRRFQVPFTRYGGDENRGRYQHMYHPRLVKVLIGQPSTEL
ncbi:hypothetical protein NPIL_411291 [Nephila pilipes]|uniref:Uncharacterized protein n=1 Tax=Nephila pilipes TaxID=299642 RepID=A0A8X6MDU0_NEPPI|nr:hypothetical protein NPIL_411291 [Nephila pilipes]